MDNETAKRFLEYLRRELSTIVESTLSVANATLFRRERRGKDAVTLLLLTPAQRVAAEENRERLMRWASAAASLLRRQGLPGDADVRQLAREMAQCVTLRWIDRGDVRERTWRANFKHELLRLSLALTRRLPADFAAPSVALAKRQPFVPFTLRIESVGENRWRMSVGELAEEVVEVASGLASPPRVLQIETLTTFGRALFDAVFVGDVARIYLRHRADAATLGRGVRIQLDTRDAGPLGTLPWELLHDGDQFLALSANTSVTRRLVSPPQRRVVSQGPPLRLLLMASSPPGVAVLDCERERLALEAALAPLTWAGLLEIDVVGGSSFGALRRRLRAADDAGRPHHVWHFIGHGGVDEQSAGVLVLTEDDGLRRDVTGVEFEAVFKDCPALRLVVLNACDGVHFRHDGSACGVATAFMRCGAPAIVAMQSPISDEAALIFSEELYGAVSDGASIETAVAEARRAIFFQPNAGEWFVPILFMDGMDGRLFE